MNPFLGFQLPRSELPEWRLLAHILEMSFSLLEHRHAEVVQMCTLHPFPSEKLLERIPSAGSVISGLGRTPNHLKGREHLFKRIICCDPSVPLKNGCHAVLLWVILLSVGQTEVYYCIFEGSQNVTSKRRGNKNEMILFFLKRVMSNTSTISTITEDIT